MIVLSDTVTAVFVKLAGAVSTLPLGCVFAVVDQSADVPFKPSGLGLDINASGNTTAIFPPNAGVLRTVRYFSVFNSDTATATVTVLYGTRTLAKVTLLTGESIVYNVDTGWVTYAATGARKITLLSGTPPIGIGAGNLAGSAATYALSDHNHAIRTGSTDLTMGTLADADVLSRVGAVLQGKTILSANSGASAITNATVNRLTFISRSLPKAGTFLYFCVGHHSESVATIGTKYSVNYDGTTTNVTMRVWDMVTTASMACFGTSAAATLIGPTTGLTGDGAFLLWGHITVTTADVFRMEFAASAVGTSTVRERCLLYIIEA